MEKVKRKIKREEFKEFMIVGLGKFCDFYHFTQEDQQHIKLVPEPSNKYDKHAIKVYVKDKHVAYVSKTHNKYINLFLKRKDHKHAFYIIDKYSKSVRVLMIDLSLAYKRST